MENYVRLNKFIASCGYSSRRKIDEMILQGRVEVNGKTVTELGVRIDPANDNVSLDGEAIKTSAKKIYILLNKPGGVITSVSDEKKRRTVIDLVNVREKIFPVGRLDYNTTGLLLLTNDGELANKLMHPGSEIYKTYFVKLSKPLEEKHRKKLEEGIKMDGRMTARSRIRFARKNDYSDLYISIYEGRNRQVRNMFEHYGYYVRELDRVDYAGLKSEGLRQGEWRYLTPEELKRLVDLAGKESIAASDNVPEKRHHKKTGKKTFTKTRSYERRERRDESGFEFKQKKRRHQTEARNRPVKAAGKDGREIPKWGFKKRLREERETKLGFKKTENEKPSYSKTKSGNRKTDTRKKSNRKNFVKHDMRGRK